jgi:hypothetical protein
MCPATLLSTITSNISVLFETAPLQLWSCLVLRSLKQTSWTKYGNVLNYTTVKRPLGRPRHRGEDNIKMDLRERGCEGVDWIHLDQDRKNWRALVKTVINLRLPQKVGNLTISSSRKTLFLVVSYNFRITSVTCFITHRGYEKLCPWVMISIRLVVQWYPCPTTWHPYLINLKVISISQT